jgi:hypothetical protein
MSEKTEITFMQTRLIRLAYLLNRLSTCLKKPMFLDI